MPMINWYLAMSFYCGKFLILGFNRKHTRIGNETGRM